MNYIKNSLLNKLGKSLKDLDNYRENPFIIFEKENFLENQEYINLVDEIYNLNDFEKFSKGTGDKKKKSINGNNLESLKKGFFKDFCKFFLSKEFYIWFKKTHLPFFKSSNKYKIYILKPRNISFRLIKKIFRVLNIPISFYYTEIEYSSIQKGGFIPPHTDAKNKRLSFVYYLLKNSDKIDEEQKKALGTVFWKPKLSIKKDLNRFDCSLLEGKEKNEFYQNYEPFYVATYDRNKFVGFIKSNNTWHTVEPFDFIYDRRAIVINVWEV
ncbi:hypothetical protein N9U63_00505 [Candidatus Pelagibacter sp.]|nr:hypothetical protein [Candidatus Pelagibacter sp.]